MAKSKKLNIKAKVHFKQPLKVCDPALKDVKRIRKNEQNKLYRLNAKFEANKKKPAVAKRIREDIFAQRKTIANLGKTAGKISGACQVINQIKADNKSLKLKNAAIRRKLGQIEDKARKRKGGFDEAEYKKLQSAYLRNSNAIRHNQNREKDVLYGVNKHLGFKPEDTAKRLNISKRQLEKNHKGDFDEGFFDEIEEVDTGEADMGGDFSGGGGGGGVAEDEPAPPKDEAPSGPAETDEQGYLVEMEEIFWRVWQDFDKNEKTVGGLAKYNRVTFEWSSSVSPGGSQYAPGSSYGLVTMMAGDAWRWASDHEPYIIAIKMVNAARTKLKYVLYWDQDGRP